MITSMFKLRGECLNDFFNFQVWGERLNDFFNFLAWGSSATNSPVLKFGVIPSLLLQFLSTGGLLNDFFIF